MRTVMSIALTQLWLPDVLYKPLPYICIIVCFLGFLVADVPIVMIAANCALGMYGLIIIIVRGFSKEFHY